MDFLIHRSSNFSVCGMLFNGLLTCNTTWNKLDGHHNFLSELKLYKWLDNKPKADMQSAKTAFLCFAHKRSTHCEIFEISGADSLGVRNALTTWQISLLSKWKIVAIGFVCLLGGRGNWVDDTLVPNHTRNNSSSRLVSCSFALPS